MKLILLLFVLCNISWNCTAKNDKDKNEKKQVCVLGWVILHGSLRSINSRRYDVTSGLSFEACLESCGASERNCEAVQYIDGHCYLAFNETHVELDLTQNDHVYLPYYCKACNKFWTQLNDVYSYYGSQPSVPNVRTPAECLIYCQNHTQCVGVDVNYITAFCHMYTTTNYFNRLYYSSDVMQFRISRIMDECSGCNSGWTTPKYRTSVDRSKQQPLRGILTAADCQKRCLHSKTCVGIEHNVAGSKCYLFNHGSEMEPGKDIQKYSYIFQNYIVRRGDFCAGCTPTWYEYPGEVVYDKFGEYEDLNFFFVEDCKKECISNIECRAIDFDEQKKRCRLHFHFNFYYEKYKNKYYTHYVLHRCKDCTFQWEFKLQYMSKGGTPFSKITDLRECQLACTRLESCYAVDFNITTATCFLNFDKRYIGVPGIKSLYSVHGRLSRGFQFCGVEADDNPSNPRDCNPVNGFCDSVRRCCRDHYCPEAWHFKNNAATTVHRCAICLGQNRTCSNDDECCYPGKCEEIVKGFHKKCNLGTEPSPF